MKSTRALALVVLLLVIVGGAWYYLSNRPRGVGSALTVYYTKLDGTTLGNLSVSLRPRLPGESAAEHLRNAVLYAAVQAVAGPSSDVQAIRFPAGTRVDERERQRVRRRSSTFPPTSSRQAGGTFGENGEFKGLVYTVTGIPGIDALKVTVGGQTLPTLPGGHLELDQPLHRSDF